MSISSEELDRMATEGDLVGIPGTEVHYDADAAPYTEAELMDVFMGRPLAERPRAKKDAIRVVVTQPMKTWLKESADAEKLNVSALVRKGMEAYLNQTHKDLRPTAAAL